MNSAQSIVCFSPACWRIMNVTYHKITYTLLRLLYTGLFCRNMNEKGWFPLSGNFSAQNNKPKSWARFNFYVYAWPATHCLYLITREKLTCARTLWSDNDVELRTTDSLFSVPVDWEAPSWSNSKTELNPVHMDTEAAIQVRSRI